MIATSLCISPNLDWFGRSQAGTVYCAATLQPLGLTEGPIVRHDDYKLTLRFAGVNFVGIRHHVSSVWWQLWALE